MGGQPFVDETLDDPAAAQRAADVRPTPLGVEVLLQPGIVRVALASAGDLGIDLRVRHGHVLGVGHLGQDEQGLDPLLRTRPELGVHVGIGLVEGLQIGLLGDALPGERRAELVVHHLDLLVDEDVRQLERRVRDGVLDDAVGEPVPRPVEGIPLETRLDVRPQGLDVGEVTERADEVGVEIGQDLLAQLPELDREMRLCAGHLLGRVVVGEGDVELGRTPTSSPSRFASKPGMSRSWPRMSGIRSDDPPSNGAPSRDPVNEMTA